jgi:hypothetical protein
LNEAQQAAYYESLVCIDTMRVQEQNSAQNWIEIRASAVSSVKLSNDAVPARLIAV